VSEERRVRGSKRNCENGGCGKKREEEEDRGWLSGIEATI